MRNAAVVASTALILGVVLSAAFVPPTFATSYLTGLKTDDNAMYSLSGNYRFSTNYTQMKVLSVVGSRVTVNFTDFPRAGFANVGTYWIDVLSGDSSNSTSNLFFVVASGLRLGDTIFDPTFDSWSIVKIVTAQSNVCGGVQRSMVYAQFNRQYQFVQIAWDQSTGVMCNYNAQDSRGSWIFKLDNTTLWASTSTPPTNAFTTASEISAALGLPLVVLIVFIFFRKRRARARARK